MTDKNELSGGKTPFDYTYEKDSTVSIPANLFSNLIEFLQVYVAEDVKTTIKFGESNVEKRDFNGVKEEDYKVEYSMSPMGYTAQKLFNVFLTIHTENIKKGLAKEQPQLKVNAEQK